MVGAATLSAAISSGDQFASRYLERVCDLLDHGNRRITRATFKITDVSAVDPGFVGEGFLAERFLGAQAAQVSGEALADIHAALETRLSPIDLQTIRDIRVDCPNTQSMGMSLIDDRNTP